MDLSAAITSGAVLAIFTAVLGWIVNGRFNRIETEIATLRSEMNSRFGEVNQEIASLRSDLLHVALGRRRDD